MATLNSAIFKRTGFKFSNDGTNGSSFWDNPVITTYSTRYLTADNNINYGTPGNTVRGDSPLIEAMDIDWRPYKILTGRSDNTDTYQYLATTTDLLMALNKNYIELKTTISTNASNNSDDVTNLTNRIDTITYSYALTTTGGVVTLTGSNPGTSVTFAGDNTWTSVSGPANANGNGTITISHIGSAVTAAAGGTGKYVSSVKFDAHGHATEISYTTLPTLLTSETAANTYKVSLSNGGAASSITMAGDGWVIPTSSVLAPANETITFTHKAISNAAGTVTAPPTTNNFITGIVTDGKGHITSYYYDDIRISSYSLIRCSTQNGTTSNAEGNYLNLIYTPEGGNATFAAGVSLADYQNEAIPTPVFSYIIDGGFRIQLGTGNNSNTLPISLTNTFAYPGNHTYNHSRYGLELKIGDTTVANIGYLYAKNSDAVTLHYPVSRTVDGDTHPVFNSGTKLYLPGVIPSTTLSPSYKDETDHWIYVSNGADGQSFPYILYTDSTYVLHTPNLNAVMSISYDSDGFKVKTNKGTASAAVPFDVSYISGTSGTGKGLKFTIGSTTADVVSFKLAKNENANTFGLRINGEVAGSDIEFPTLSLANNQRTNGQYMSDTTVNGHTITNSYISLLSTATADANGKYVSDAKINSSGSIELTYTNLLDGSTSAGTNLYVSKLEINSTGNIKATYTSLPTIGNASLIIQDHSATTYTAITANATTNNNLKIKGDGTWTTTSITTNGVLTVSHIGPDTTNTSTKSAGTGKYISGVTVDGKGHVTAVTDTNLPTIGNATLIIQGDSTTYNSITANATTDKNIKIKGDGTWISTAFGTGNNGILTISHNAPDTSNTSTKSAGTNKYVSGVTVDSKGHVTAITDAALPTIPSLSLGTNNYAIGKYVAGTGVSGHQITNSYISLLNGNNDAANIKYVSKLEINSSGNIKASYTTLLSASNGSTNHAGYIANIVNDGGTLKATYGSFAPSIANVIADDGHPTVKITVAGCDSTADTIEFSSYTAGVYSKSGIPQYQNGAPSSEWDDIFIQHVGGNDTLLVTALNDTRINKGVAYIGAWDQTNNHHLYIDPVTKTMQGNKWIDFEQNAPFILNTDTKVKYLFAPSIVTSNIYGIATQAIGLTSNPEISYVSGNSGGIKIKAGTKESTTLPIAFSYVTGNNNGLRLSIGSQNFTTPFAFSYVSGNNNGLRLSVGGQNFTVPLTLGNGTTNNIVKLTIGSVEKTVTVNNVANATNAINSLNVNVKYMEGRKIYSLIGTLRDSINTNNQNVQLYGWPPILGVDCADINNPIFVTGCNITAISLGTSGNIQCGGKLTVTGATTLSSTLGVTGVTTLSNNLVFNGTNRNITGVAGITGNDTVSEWSFWNTNGGRKTSSDIVENAHAVVSPDPAPLAPLGGGSAVSGGRITYIETRSTVPAVPNANTMYVLI